VIVIIKEGDTMNGLTPKQEKFIQNVVSGMTQRQAYKEAYQNNMTDKQIDEEACKLFNSPKINQRYQELMEELKDKAIMTAKERMIWLSDVVRGNIKHISYGSEGQEYENEAYISDKLKAVDTLNKMSGEYVTKVMVTKLPPAEQTIQVKEWC
jgi:hypothetical protein